MNHRNPFAILFAAFLMLLAGCLPALANEYNAIVTNSLPVAEYPKSSNETKGFAAIRLSPDDFMQAVGDDIGQLYRVLEKSGVETRDLPLITSTQVKRFTFWDVPVSGEPSNAVVLRYGETPSYLAVVFVYTRGEWQFIDVLSDVEWVETANGLTNTWLKTTASAFLDSVQIECLYDLSSRLYAVQYLSHATGPAYDAGPDAVVYTSACSRIDEYSVAQATGSVYSCYLYVVRNTSLCSWEDDAITEQNAATEIDIYSYDYDSAAFTYLQTNRYERIGAATIDGLLRHDVLLSETAITKNAYHPLPGVTQ